MLEYLSPTLIYRIAQDLFRWLLRRRRSLTASEKLARRGKWKPIFEEELLKRKVESLNSDVIIRDVGRMDDYPEVEETKRGISAWFKVGLMGTYHRGFYAGLRWTGLKWDEKAEQWRYPNRKSGEEPDVKCMLMGYVPYEFVESVDWDGDKYYSEPHVYCHFDGPKGEPYEKLAFCERHVLEYSQQPIEYWTEIAELKPVLKLSRKRGASDW